MKHRHYFHFFLGGIAASSEALPLPCSGSKWTGDGPLGLLYKGNRTVSGQSQEDFRPELVKDDTYNIALMRAAYQSSAYDFAIQLPSWLPMGLYITESSVSETADSDGEKPGLQEGVDDR